MNLKQLFLPLFVALLLLVPTQADAAELPSSNNVPTDKKWTISFSANIDSQANFNNYIGVVDENGQQQDVTIQSEDEKKITIYAPDNGYQPNKTYKIIVKEGFESEKGKPLKQQTIKSFTTASTTKANEFQVRKDAANDITYVESFKQLTEQQVQDTNYDAGRIIITSSAAVGDFLALPPTSDYPNGFVAEVIAVQQQNNETVITFNNADIEDYVVDIDISTLIDVDASHVSLNEELFSTRVASLTAKNSTKGKIEKLNNGFKINLFDFHEEFEKDYKGKKKGVEYDIKGKGHITFDADFTFDNPKFFYDKALSRKNDEMAFSADQTLSFDAKVSGTLNGKITYKIADIGVPRLHIDLNDHRMGVYASIYVEVILDGKGNASFKIVEKYTTKASYKKSEGAKFTVKKNDSKSVDFKESLNIEGELNTDISLPLTIGFYLFDDQLGKIGVRPIIETEFKAQQAYTELFNQQRACAKFVVSAKGHAEFELTLSKKIEYFKKLSLTSGELFKWANCDIKELILSDETVDLEAGNSKALTLSAKLDNKTQKLSLPNNAIKWESNNRNVVVSSSGVVTVSKTAKAGETATITATLPDGKKTYKATTKVYVISNERPETFLYLSKNDNIISIVNSRNQTFGKEYYTIDTEFAGENTDLYRMTLPPGEYVLNLKREDGSTVKYGYSVFKDELDEYFSSYGPYFEKQLILTKEDFYDYVYDLNLLKIKDVSFTKLKEMQKEDPWLTEILKAKVVDGKIEATRIKNGTSIITVIWDEEGVNYNQNYYINVSNHMNGYMLTFPY